MKALQNRFILFLFIITLTQGLLMSATLKNIKHKNTTVPIIFEKHKSLPIFNLQLIFKNSGYINDSKMPGLTNLTAQILNEGTKQEGSIKFARKLENKAISISTNTGFETFVIEVSCLKSEYQTALKYLNDILQDPNLTLKTLNKLKMLQASKLEQKENDFDYVASKLLKSTTYKNTPLEHTSYGTIETLENIKIKDIQANLENILNINNLIIAVGGDIKIKEFKENFKPLLNNLKNKDSKDINRIKFNTQEKEKVVKKETQQSYIYFASPFNLDANSKENYKAKVASFILGGSGFGSRLMEEIRVKHGLAYSAYGYITNKKSHSHFTGYLQTKLENTQKAKDMVSSIVNEFVKNGVTNEELEAAKNFLMGSEPLRTETFSQRLNRAFMLYYKGLSFDHPQEELKRIEELSVEELNSFIKSHTEIKNLTFSIVTK